MATTTGQAEADSAADSKYDRLLVSNSSSSDSLRRSPAPPPRLYVNDCPETRSDSSQSVSVKVSLQSETPTVRDADGPERRQSGMPTVRDADGTGC